MFGECIELWCMCISVLRVLCAKDDSALSCGFEPKRGSSRIVKHKVKVRHPSFFLVHGDMIHARSRVLWCGYEAFVVSSVTVCVYCVVLWWYEGNGGGVCTHACVVQEPPCDMSPLSLSLCLIFPTTISSVLCVSSSLHLFFPSPVPLGTTTL